MLTTSAALQMLPQMLQEDLRRFREYLILLPDYEAPDIKPGGKGTEAETAAFGIYDPVIADCIADSFFDH